MLALTGWEERKKERKEGRKEGRKWMAVCLAKGFALPSENRDVGGGCGDRCRQVMIWSRWVGVAFKEDMGLEDAC